MKKLITYILIGLAFLVLFGALFSGTMINGSCTGWFDGYWQTCCTIHDSAYGAHIDKEITDLNLANCVADSGHPGIGMIMYYGVHFFGWIFY